MSERRDGAPPDAPGPFDQEIDVPAIAKSAIWLFVVTIASFVAAWAFYRALARGEERLDPRPPLIEAARKPVVPPGPRLQRSPEGELAAFRAAEERALEASAWVDRGRGVARVPIERAIEAVASAGRLPDFAPAPAPAVEEPPAP
jgi:hypothetical protein